MAIIVFRNGTGLPEYPPDHIRVIELRPGADPLLVAQLAMSGDPTLNNYVGVADRPAARSVTVNGAKGRCSARNCWRWNGSQVQVDMPLLRLEYLRVLRQERDARLLASDGPWMRSVERGLPAERPQWEAYRQALRDLPAAVAADLPALATPEALEAYMPAWPVEP